MSSIRKIFLTALIGLGLTGCDVVMNTQVGNEVGYSSFISYYDSTATELVKRPDGLWDYKHKGEALGQLKASSQSIGKISFEVTRAGDKRLWVGRKFDLVQSAVQSPVYACAECVTSSAEDRTHLPVMWTAKP